MEQLDGFRTIVISGHWNARIFTPDWVLENLCLGAPDTVIEVAVDLAQPMYRLTFEGMNLHVGSSRIMVNPARPLDDELLDRMGKLIDRVLEHLPHTPVSAMGINLRWVERQLEQDWIGLFRLPGARRFADAGAEVGKTTAKWELLLAGRQLNLTVEYVPDDASMVIDFNFHTDLRDTQHARRQLADGVREYQTLAERMLAHIVGGDGHEGNSDE